MAEDARAERLRRLNERLDAARPKPSRPHQEEHYSQAHLAWRMVIEMVAGLGIGFGIGYGLDALFGTLPWLLVTFTLLGFAAGVKTMIASAQEVQRKALDDAPGPQDGDR